MTQTQGLMWNEIGALVRPPTKSGSRSEILPQKTCSGTVENKSDRE